MNSGVLQKWSLVIFVFYGGVHSQMMQMAYPMGGYGAMMMPMPPPPPPPPMAMAMPMPVPVPVAIAVPYEEKKTTTTSTTTTTEKPREPEGDGSDGDMRIPIAIPVPVPHFVQIAVPGFQSPVCQNGQQRGNNCPPCPPCTCNPCTPSFFSYCSPCHLQCRCKSSDDAPIPQEPKAPMPLPGPAFPMPIPMPGPPPVVIVPFPPQFKRIEDREFSRPSTSGECDSRSSEPACSEESPSCESNETNDRKKRKRKSKSKKQTKYDIYRRRNMGFRNRDRSDNELVKPVLTYMSRNGNVKVKRRLSNDEANALIGEGDSYQNVHLIAGEDSDSRPRVVVVGKTNSRSNDHRRRQVLLRNGMSQHVLGEGRKELVFRPPDNRKITNLSVSFQIE